MRVPRISYARGADGVSLAFTVAGDGPALVFAPWVPFSNLRMEWQNPLLHQVFEQLAQELTLVHYDGRGTGHSQRDVTDLSLEAMVSDLEAVIDRLNLDRLILFGYWRSGLEAIVYAADHPDRVSHLILGVRLHWARTSTGEKTCTGRCLRLRLRIRAFMWR